jgi:subtilisin family serine protease
MAGNGSDRGSARADAGVGARPNQLTGNYLVLLEPGTEDAGLAALHAAAGTGAPEHVSADDAPGAAEVLQQGGAVVFDEIGVGVVAAEPDQREAVMRAAAEAQEVLVIEPERVLYAFGDGVSAEYLRGYRDGVTTLVDHALGGLGTADGGSAAAGAGAGDESVATWGLQATGVLRSCYTGQGVRLAVLDTGVNVLHRDLAGRVLHTRSFIHGESVEDGHGHGTHCIGTACGTREPTSLPRYGVAGGAEIFAGKVLSDEGSGGDASILAGINWAVGQDCHVISMSLGAPSNVGDAYSRIYETVARRALGRGTIIVAAAGNESNRPMDVRPVGHPANCPSILAVAALSPQLGVAPFSCAGLNPDGGQVDIAAPGMDVLSSWPEPTGHRRLNGTSMATPHVAGILALLTEAHPTSMPAERKVLLLAGARRLELASTDVGAGLVQAP